MIRGREQLPQDYSCQEVAQAAKLAGCEGYAIMKLLLEIK